MSHNNNKPISPLWAAFKKTWITIATLLLLFLALLWFFGYGPGRSCAVNMGGMTTDTNKTGTTLSPEEKPIDPDIILNNIGSTRGDASIVRVPLGSRFTDTGAIAVDSTGGDIDVKVAGEVDTSVAGEYVLSYSATDELGNTTYRIRTVIVVDEKAGEAVKAAMDTDSTEPKGKATVKATTDADSVDPKGKATVKVTTDTDSTEPKGKAIVKATTDTDSTEPKGKATVKATKDTDSAEPKGKATVKATTNADSIVPKDRDVTLSKQGKSNKVKPILILNGAVNTTIAVGEDFIDAGATAHDGQGNDLRVKVVGVVDNKILGEYTLIYTAKDSAGNAVEATRKVMVITGEKKSRSGFSLNGERTVTIQQGSAYIEKGIVAASGEKMTVAVSGVVDADTVGRYELDYLITNAKGRKSTIRRTVIVEPTSQEVLNKLTVAKLYFGLNKSTPSHDRDNTLPKVLKILQDNPDTKAYVSGFHDPSGSIIDNRRLAKNRAKTVIALLQEKGIRRSRIVVREPTETTGTGAPGEARRVEVEVKQ
ncbi:MAG: DUF5011 domain-containing protein [Thiotrichaceae bacterium]|nr:DUF5011 domain-containing protein [Thiotrichaceae bacterium]